ncbi:hypothetical protein C5167_033581, partial [Papaver somniferum]
MILVWEAVKKRAEEARKAAAFEVENRRVKEAAEKEVTENAKKTSEETQKREASQTLKDVNMSEPGRSGSYISPSAGSLVRASDSALRVEVERLQKLKEVDKNNQAFRLSHNQSAISKEDYFKVMGFREEDGTAESRESYLEGVASYMKLYGALIQTEVSGVQKLHGLKEGWAWIARLLNSLPANIYTT